MRARAWAGTAALFAACVASRAVGGSDAIPRYEPGARVPPTTLRVWGNDAMAALAERWREGFERQQPDVKLAARLLGTGTAMAGLYSDAAELAFMGREATPKELMAFEWVFRYKPTRVELATGSLATPGRSPALAVFVHKDNPLTRMTLARLDAVFSDERRRGAPATRTWDQLGLGGEWAGRPITAYGYDVESGSGSFFRRVVLQNSYKLSWDRVREFRDAKAPDGSLRGADRSILDALANDRYGIAISVLGAVNPSVKPLALGVDAAGPWTEATSDSLVSRRYPLARAVTAWINRPPGTAPSPAVREFLRYVLSREGQDAVIAEGSFLPLSAEAVREQREKLE